MSGFFTVSIIQSAMELGCIYALVALALFISYSMLNIADLSTDGCFTLGCAVGAIVTLSGHPVLALFAAMASGMLSGLITAFLQTRMGVESILAGIIVNTGLYTINIMVMGFSSNVNIFRADTIFSLFHGIAENLPALEGWHKLILVLSIVVLVGLFLAWFLNTRLGLSVRATGDNPSMVKASSINPAFTITAGLMLSNSLTALSGAVLAQYQKSCDINYGTGMVTIALASLIIGESLIGRGGMMIRILGVIFGSCLYRFFVALALRLNIPAESLKLVSALIVAAAISFPFLKNRVSLYRRMQDSRMRNRKGGGNA